MNLTLQKTRQLLHAIVIFSLSVSCSARLSTMGFQHSDAGFSFNATNPTIALRLTDGVGIERATWTSFLHAVEAAMSNSTAAVSMQVDDGLQTLVLTIDSSLDGRWSLFVQAIHRQPPHATAFELELVGRFIYGGYDEPMQSRWLSADAMASKMWRALCSALEQAVKAPGISADIDITRMDKLP